MLIMEDVLMAVKKDLTLLKTVTAKHQTTVYLLMRVNESLR